MRRLALLVLATGLLAVGWGQTSGHTPLPIATPPPQAFHAVTDDIRLPQPPPAVVDDFAHPTPVPRPSVAVPAPHVTVVQRPAPTPRPAPTRKQTPRPVARPAPAPAVVTYPSVADAKAYALQRLGSTQFGCLNEIAIHESNWNPHDVNPTSGAYGIPQALPGTKMSTAGADWHDNPVTQVKWMIGYVDADYGSACAAWSFWQAHRWY